jgi:hypothetical protein
MERRSVVLVVEDDVAVRFVIGVTGFKASLALTGRGGTEDRRCVCQR